MQTISVQQRTTQVKPVYINQPHLEKVKYKDDLSCTTLPYSLCTSARKPLPEAEFVNVQFR